MLLGVMGKSQIKLQCQITNHLTKSFRSLCPIRNQITNHFSNYLTKCLTQVHHC